MKIRKVKSLDELNFGDVLYNKGATKRFVLNHFVFFTSLKGELEAGNLFVEIDKDGLTRSQRRKLEE